MRFLHRTRRVEMLACMRMAHEAQIPLLAVTTALWAGSPSSEDLWEALDTIKEAKDTRAAYWTGHESYFTSSADAAKFKHEAVERCIDLAKTFDDARWGHSFATTPDQKTRSLGKMRVLGAEFVAQAKTAAELLKFHGDLLHIELPELKHAILTRALELASSAEEARSVYFQAPDGSSLRSAAIRKLAPFYGIEAS